ncbi:MAG: glycosyltransferase family 9 protein [Candidatus Margulisiibacteriota bacterium]
MSRRLPTEKIKKVLIIRPDALGDMVLTLPCVAAIKKAYPQWHVAVLASPYNARIMSHMDCFDEVILDKFRTGEAEGKAGFWRYVRWLKTQNFDLAIHFYSETPTVWLSVFAGIPYHIGDKAKLGLWPIFRKYGAFLKTFDQTKHVVEYNFQLLKALGITLDPEQKLSLTVPPGQTERAKDLLNQAGRRWDKPLVGIQIGVGFGNRPIEPEKFAEFVNALRRHRDVDVCVTPFTDKEKAFRDRFVAACQGPVLNLDDTKITELMGVISLYSVYVSVDTGPFHIGAALGVPMLAIFPSRKVKPTRWAPWRNRHLMVRESRTCPLFCPHEGCPLTICSDAIRVEDMVAKTEILLDGGGVESANDQFAYWFKASMTVLVLDDAKTEAHAKAYADHLNALGIVAHRTSVYTPELPAKLLEGDITIIHNFSGKRRLYLAWEARKIALKLFNPPLLIHTAKNPLPEAETIAYYKDAFEHKRF